VHQVTLKLRIKKLLGQAGS